MGKNGSSLRDNGQYEKEYLFASKIFALTLESRFEWFSLHFC